MTVESATGPSTRWISGDLGAGWQRVECGTYRYGISPAGTTTFEPSGVVERYVEFISEDGARRRTRALRDARATPAGVELRVETWDARLPKR